MTLRKNWETEPQIRDMLIERNDTRAAIRKRAIESITDRIELKFSFEEGIEYYFDCHRNGDIYYRVPGNKDTLYSFVDYREAEGFLVLCSDNQNLYDVAEPQETSGKEYFWEIKIHSRKKCFIHCHGDEKEPLERYLEFWFVFDCFQRNTFRYLPQFIVSEEKLPRYEEIQKSLKIRKEEWFAKKCEQQEMENKRQEEVRKLKRMERLRENEDEFLKEIGPDKRLLLDTFAAFTGKLMAIVGKENDKENILLSPISIYEILAVIASAGDGESRLEILKLLDMSYEECLDLAKGLYALFQIETTHVGMANGVYINPKIEKWINQDFFKGSNFEKIDGTGDAVENINRWVDDATNHMIDKIVEDKLKDDIAILNAVTFDAEWKTPYWDDEERKEYFTDVNGNRDWVKMLHSREIQYIETHMVTGFIKDYGDCEYSFMALLPKSGLSTSDVLSNMQGADWRHYFLSASQEIVIADLPEFEFDFKKELIETMKELGVKTVFDMNSADLRNMVSMDKSYLSKVFHKSHISVTKEGTKAAAVTLGGVVCAGGAPTKVKFVRLDRPFIFAIMNKSLGIPIFTGVYSKVK